MISLIAAIGKNNELGKSNTLLWHLPVDMKHFKETTTLHPVIMGRKTFESIGHPLPNRRNIVITRNVNYKKEGVELAYSLNEALDLFPDQNEEIFIIGGAELYRQTMPIADKLYITHIDAEDKDADAFFPEIIPIVWNEVSHIEHEADEKNIYPYTFSIYEKFQ
ncbi:MAG: dihydrofolate reductase [Candidatus Pacebacteria bacterium]|nr:dihydrofolate reductase [Candidatus Paceibacterota bacterium]